MFVYDDKTAIAEAQSEVAEYVRCLLKGTPYRKRYKVILGDAETVLEFSELSAYWTDRLREEISSDTATRNKYAMYLSLRKWDSRVFPEDSQYKSLSQVEQEVLPAIGTAARMRILIQAYTQFVDDLQGLIMAVTAPDFIKLIPEPLG